MKFYMKQKVFALVDKYNIYDQNERLKYKVEGKFFSWRGKMKLLKDGQVIYTFSHRIFTFINRYLDIFSKNGEQVGTVVKNFSFFVPKMTVKLLNESYRIKGEIFAHSFMIYHDNRVVAVVAKKWLSWGDTYEIDIDDSENFDLIVALVIGIDSLNHNGRYNGG